MTRKHSKRRALSLTSVLVTASIMAVLAGMLAASLGKARGEAREAVCSSNLRQVAMALEMFNQDQGQYPDDYPEGEWVEKVLPYLDDKAVLMCPEHDGEEDEDLYGVLSSYATLYVKRSEIDGDENRFVLGCPRHRDRGLSAVLFGKKSVDKVTTDVVRWVSEDGVDLGNVGIGDTVIGDTALGGRLEFADGSVAELSENLEVRILQSFRQADGTLYTVVRVSDDWDGTINCTVNKGSKFDVVTPAIIAGAEGTAFWVRTWTDGSGAVRSDTGITEGRIYVVDKETGKTRHLTASATGTETDDDDTYAESAPQEPEPEPVTVEEVNEKYEKYMKKARKEDRKADKHEAKADKEEAKRELRKAEKHREKAEKHRWKARSHRGRAKWYLNGGVDDDDDDDGDGDD